jgi:AcrR family transcriptional regulator
MSPESGRDRLPSGRHGLPRETVQASQRQRIIEAMIDVVADKGYGDATIADVIRIAGVSRKTYYELFDDKDSCFLAAYDQAVGQMLEATTEAYEADADAPWTERIRAGLGAWLGFIADNPAAARCCIVEVLAAGPKALARRDAAIRQFTHFLDEGRSESSVQLPGLASLAVVGGINELIYSEILHGATAQLPSRLPDLMYWTVQPYLGEKRALEERKKARRQAPKSSRAAASST